METKFARGVNEMRPVRLRLILAPAADVRGATDWLGALEQLRGTDQHYPWMPRQNTESMLLWAHAALDPCSGWAPKLRMNPRLDDGWPESGEKKLKDTKFQRIWIKNKMEKQKMKKLRCEGE